MHTFRRLPLASVAFALSCFAYAAEAGVTTTLPQETTTTTTTTTLLIPETVCGDFIADDRITASDALGVLQAAVGVQPCGLCICDVDDSGAVVASDALIVLSNAVGVGVGLTCPLSGGTVSWDGGGDGALWEDGLNWSADRVPDECDIVLIDPDPPALAIGQGDVALVVTHGTGDHRALAIISTAELVLSGGSLTVMGPVSVANRFAVVAATLSRARIAAAAGGTVEMFIGTHLDGVIIDSEVNATTTSTHIAVTNGLTVNGLLRLGSNGSLTITGVGEQTLSGNGEIRAEAGGVGAFIQAPDEGTTLRIGETLTVGGNGAIILADEGLTIDGTVMANSGFGVSISSSSWVNNGAIVASNTTALTIGGIGTNNGTISADSGGRLTIDGDWLNLGDITATDATVTLGSTNTTAWDNDGSISATNSTVGLGGLLTLDSIGMFEHTGGQVLLNGTLDNSTNLVLDEERGDWIVANGGTIQGGTVTAMPGFDLTVWFGTMDGVTLNTPVDMNTFSAFASFTNGTVLNDTLTLGSLAILSIDAVDEAILSGSGSVEIPHTGASGALNSTATTLRIANGFRVAGATGGVGNGSTHFINDGRIEAVIGGGPFNVGAITCTNNGELIAEDVPVRLFGDCTNNGLLQARASRYIQAQADLTLAAGGTVELELSSPGVLGQLLVLGDITLGGTLSITLADGFAPMIGQMFPVMTYQSMTGAFASVEGLSLGNGLVLQQNVSATGITLEVVAE